MRRAVSAQKTLQDSETKIREFLERIKDPPYDKVMVFPFRKNNDFFYNSRLKKLSYWPDLLHPNFLSVTSTFTADTGIWFLVGSIFSFRSFLWLNATLQQFMILFVVLYQ